MPIRLGAFEKPKRLKKEEEAATKTNARFTAEPFEIGYGHTIGNAMRRVLLSSLEGAAITSLKVEGAAHEFATIDGVVEDIRARETGDGIVAIDEVPPFAKGEAVRVTTGPLAELVGLFEDMTDGERVTVLFDLLGRQMPVCVPADHLTAFA